MLSANYYILKFQIPLDLQIGLNILKTLFYFTIISLTCWKLTKILTKRCWIQSKVPLKGMNIFIQFSGIVRIPISIFYKTNCKSKLGKSLCDLDYPRNRLIENPILNIKFESKKSCLQKNYFYFELLIFFCPVINNNYTNFL